MHSTTSNSAKMLPMTVEPALSTTTTSTPPKAGLLHSARINSFVYVLFFGILVTFGTIVHSLTGDSNKVKSQEAFALMFVGCLLGMPALIAALAYFNEEVKKIPGIRNDLYWLGVMVGIYIGMIGVWLFGFVRGAVDVTLGALWGAVIAMASGLLVRVDGGIVAGLKSLL